MATWSRQVFALLHYRRPASYAKNTRKSSHQRVPERLFAMSSRNRNRNRETDLVIKVASGEPLAANSLLMRSLCDSADGLPAAAEVWDVSGLLLDCQPFSTDTVSCWLSCAHSLLHGTEELSPRDKQQLSAVTGLTQVLAFADAVGSVKGLIEAACSQLQQLKFVVQLPEQVLELPVAGYTYCVDVVEGDQDQDWGEHLVRSSLLEPVTNVSTRMDRPQRNALEQQVAKQAANLLRLAHVLRLQPLLDVLHGFVLLNADRLLWGVGGLVFNDAVLANTAWRQPWAAAPSTRGHIPTACCQSHSAVCPANLAPTLEYCSQLGPRYLTHKNAC